MDGSVSATRKKNKAKKEAATPAEAAKDQIVKAEAELTKILKDPANDDMTFAGVCVCFEQRGPDVEQDVRSLMGCWCGLSVSPLALLVGSFRTAILRYTMNMCPHPHSRLPNRYAQGGKHSIGNRVREQGVEGVVQNNGKAFDG